MSSSSATFRSHFRLKETLAIVILAGLLLWKGIIPGWRILNTDFPNYYLVARLMREGYNLDRIYDWIWLQRVKDHWGLDQTLVGFAGLTPFSALPVLPLSFCSALAAKRLWILANLLFMYGSVECLNRVSALGRRRIWVLFLLAIYPLRTSFLYGQMHLLVLFLLALAYFFHRRDKQIASGACLAIAGMLKVYPLLFAGYFLWKGRKREAAAVLCSMLLLMGVGYLWIGSHVIQTYLTEVLPRSLQGEVLDPYSARAASGAALFHRLFIYEPQLNPHPAFRSPILYAMLYPLWQILILFPLALSVRHEPRHVHTEHLEWAALIISLLVLSPVPSSYHFVVMVFSIVLLSDVLLQRKRYGLLAIALGLYFLISMIEFSPVAASDYFTSITLLAFARLWIGMLLVGLLMFSLRTEKSSLEIRAGGWRSTYLLAASFAAFWIAGFVGHSRHFAYLDVDIDRRIATHASTYLAAGLHAKGGGYLFTAMTPSGYRVMDDGGNEIWNNTFNGSSEDQLSFSVGANSALILMEVADATGSRIVETPLARGSDGFVSENLLHLSNAESAAVSPDEAQVAYIREDLGIGRLLLARLQANSGHVRTTEPPTQIVSNAYDVRDVTFGVSGNIVFTAKMAGKTRIFEVFPGGLPHVLIYEENDVMAPAISSDGRMVAYRQLTQRRWQLVVSNRTTGRKQYLTFGDCNAYSPTWLDGTTIGYATDCGRGLGLTALASVHIDN